MRKWEYCRVVWAVKQVIRIDDLEDHWNIQPQIDGTYLITTGSVVMPSNEKIPITRLLDTMNDLGDEEWEMVIHTKGEHPEYGQLDVFYFKRPR